jgi:hypothetical protein
MKGRLFACAIAVCALFECTLAKGDEVTFENYTGPSTFAAAGPEQTLIYPFSDVTATFTGGVILTNETSQSTDDTSVYATLGPDYGGDPSLTNPLVVSFSAPIQNFSIQILNALSGNYVMSDNVGDSMDFSLATTGGSLATEGFAAAGTQVTIDYTSSSTAWDFAIDNVTFDQALPIMPEPASAGLLVGAGVLALRRRTQRRLVAC